MEGKVVLNNTECSNSGCSLTFAERKSKPVCIFHPGVPVFHEGLKYWSCCKKKVTHFEDFMRQKGCAQEDHCWIPKAKMDVPKEVEKVTEVVKEVSEEIRPKINAMERPDVNSQMIDIQVEVGPNFQRQVQPKNGEKSEGEEIRKCQNSGCSVIYGDEKSNQECIFHSGDPIFHEGLKYWSCCKKKSMEFEEFVKQKGCTTGGHCWSKKEVDFRFDWHQTSSHVIVTIYAKGCFPSNMSIKANGIRLLTSFALQTGMYKQDWTLHGIIEESKSSATLLSTKVEIKLKKAEAAHWTSFLF